MHVASAGDKLDTPRVQALAGDIMDRIKEHYERGPMGRARVYEVINALALCTALTVHGADPDSQFATDLFAAAFEANLDLYREKFPNQPQDN